jgi:uncharacterized membrane protein YoaK (UPF0700 family)
MRRYDRRLIADALGFLGLGGFVSFMNGNTTRFGGAAGSGLASPARRASCPICCSGWAFSAACLAERNFIG